MDVLSSPSQLLAIEIISLVARFGAPAERYRACDEWSDQLGKSVEGLWNDTIVEHYGEIILYKFHHVPTSN